MFPMNNDFLMNTSQLENRITRYWDHRADDFTRVRHEEFHSVKSPSTKVEGFPRW